MTRVAGVNQELHAGEEQDEAACCFSFSIAPPLAPNPGVDFHQNLGGLMCVCVCCVHLEIP